MKITKLEKKVLLQLHLQGFWGKSGSLNKTQRLKLLNGLISNGLLTLNCQVTIQGQNIAKY